MNVAYYTAGQAKAEAAKMPADLLDGVLHTGTTILYGPSGIGKGRVIAELVTAGVSGQPWAGRTWCRPVERVAIIATDVGAVREYGAYLEHAGLGLEHEEQVRIYPVETAPSSARWAETTGAVIGWHPSLVVLDNGTEMVRGSVNDNERVAELFADLRTLHSGRDRVPLLIAHHTAKPDPKVGNRRGRTPLGSVAWETFSRSKIYAREAYAGDHASVTLEIRPREAAPWEAHLIERDDRLMFDHAGDPAERKAQRRQDTSARDGEIARWYDANCRRLTNADASRVLADQFPILAPSAKDRPRAIASMLSKGTGFAALIGEAQAA